MTTPNQNMPPRTAARPGRGAFFAIKDQVAAELRAGDHLTTIFKAREHALPFTYKQFCKYVSRYLPAERNASNRVAPPGQGASGSALTAPTGGAAPAAAMPADTPQVTPTTSPGPLRAVVRPEPPRWDPAALDPDELFGKRADQ